MKCPLSPPTLASAEAARQYWLSEKAIPASLMTMGVEEAGDGGHGVYTWDRENVDDNDGALVIRPYGWDREGAYVRALQGWLTWEMFGIRPGAMGQHDKLQAAFNAAARTHRPLLLPPGRLYHRGLLYKSNIHVQGTVPRDRTQGASDPAATTLILEPGCSPPAVLMDRDWYHDTNDYQPGLVMRDLVIDVNYSGGNEGEIDGLILRTWRATLQNVTIMGGNGFALRGSARTRNGFYNGGTFTRNRILHCNVESGAKGCLFGDSGIGAPAWTDATMLDTIFTNPNGLPKCGDRDHPVVEVRNAGGWQIAGNVINHCDGDGFHLRGCKSTHVVNNRIDGWGESAEQGGFRYGIKATLGLSNSYEGLIAAGNFVYGARNTALADLSAGIYADLEHAQTGAAQIQNNQIVARYSGISHAVRIRNDNPTADNRMIVKVGGNLIQGFSSPIDVLVDDDGSVDVGGNSIFD